MLTYQDYLKVDEKDLPEFVRNVISNHKASNLYLTARIADEYDRCRNTTTMQYQRMITEITGKKTVDKTATVHRSTSNFFNIIVTQLNQDLLGNGVHWKQKQELGKDFDTRLQQAGKLALRDGVSFGFWDYDRMQVFSALEFAPLYDEENGALAAGVRFWQLDANKPVRATLYTMDGYTNYLWSSEAIKEQKWQRLTKDCYTIPRTAYKVTTRSTEADGVEIYAGENYPVFPIVPLYGNPRKQSELIGLREKIDAYDFIVNGWEDDLDNAQLYWIIKGAGGMDDPDLTRFLERLRTVKAAAPEDGQEVEPVEVNIPVDAREELLKRLEKQIYRDAMIMNPEDIASGAATATQIRAAYERQNVKADQYEYCVLDFLRGITAVAGVDGEATFTRSAIVNTQEEVQTVIMAAEYLTEEYVTSKILDLFGDGDKAEAILKRRAEEADERLRSVGREKEEQEE